MLYQPPTDKRMKMMTIRLRLIRARELACLSQTRAARLMGIHRPTLTMIESGDQKLTVEMMLTMCEAYRCYPADVIRYGDETEMWLRGSSNG